MPLDARQPLLLGPATISVHDDRDVTRLILDHPTFRPLFGQLGCDGWQWRLAGSEDRLFSIGTDRKDTHGDTDQLFNPLHISKRRGREIIDVSRIIDR